MSISVIPCPITQELIVKWVALQNDILAGYLAKITHQPGSQPYREAVNRILQSDDYQECTRQIVNLKMIEISAIMVSEQMTKQELLDKLIELDACYPAQEWASEQPDMETILKDCPLDWRLWALRKGLMEFVEHCNWDSLDREDWSYLLCYQPRLAKHRTQRTEVEYDETEITR